MLLASIIAMCDKWLIVCPQAFVLLDAYVDADFTGFADLGETALSHSSYIINFYGCPIDLCEYIGL